jgi:hypothetical protein
MCTCFGSLTSVVVALILMGPTSRATIADAKTHGITESVQRVAVVEPEIVQIRTRNTSVQLHDKYAQGPRVSAYRMKLDDGVVHESLEHKCGKIRGRVLYSRRANGRFSKDSVTDEARTHWADALAGSNNEAIEWGDVGQVISTMGPVGLQFNIVISTTDSAHEFLKYCQKHPKRRR